MVQSIADPSTYFHCEDDKLIGINGTYVDDLLRCGTLELEELCNMKYKKLVTTGTEDITLTFARSNNRRRTEDAFSFDQLFYNQKLETMQGSASWSELHSMCMKLAWLANSRPDLVVDISQLAKVAEHQFNGD